MKKILVILLSVSIILIPTLPAYANEASADTLYSLGLFKGTDSGFELDRIATRAEIAVTLVRLLGKEEKASLQQNPHPFLDVPQWASNYVGYLYENYLVSGISENEFGTYAEATQSQFATMLLRALGYSDADGDFSYNDSIEFAKNLGFTFYEDSSLSRDEMTSLSLTALKTPLKNARRTLAQKLCLDKVYSEDAAVSARVMLPFDAAEMFYDIPETLGTMSARISGDNVILKLENPAETYGLRLYCAEENEYYKEITKQGNTYFTKNEEYIGGGAAAYTTELVVHGLDFSKKFYFILTKTSSETTLFQFLCRTPKTGLSY